LIYCRAFAELLCLVFIPGFWGLFFSLRAEDAAPEDEDPLMHYGLAKD